MRIELHPDARAELRAAALWYDERRSNLGDDLIAEVSAALGRVAESPNAYPRWPDTLGTAAPIRKAGVDRFPFLVAFEVHPKHILVPAIAHAKRRPLYWIVRATPERM